MYIYIYLYLLKIIEEYIELVILRVFSRSPSPKTAQRWHRTVDFAGLTGFGDVWGFLC